MNTKAFKKYKLLTFFKFIRFRNSFAREEIWKKALKRASASDDRTSSLEFEVCSLAAKQSTLRAHQLLKAKEKHVIVFVSH